MPEHFNTFPIRAAARHHSVAHTSLSWCHSLLTDRLKVKGGGGGGEQGGGEAGLTIQESSWLMGISRSPEREVALEESHKKTSSIAARMCLGVCACVCCVSHFTPAPARLRLFTFWLRYWLDLNSRALCISDGTFPAFKQFDGRPLRGWGRSLVELWYLRGGEDANVFNFMISFSNNSDS